MQGLIEIGPGFSKGQEPIFIIRKPVFISQKPGFYMKIRYPVLSKSSVRRIPMAEKAEKVLLINI